MKFIFQTRKIKMSHSCQFRYEFNRNDAKRCRHSKCKKFYKLTLQVDAYRNLRVRFEQQIAWQYSQILKNISNQRLHKEMDKLLIGRNAHQKKLTKCENELRILSEKIHEIRFQLYNTVFRQIYSSKLCKSLLVTYRSDVEASFKFS